MHENSTRLKNFSAFSYAKFLFRLTSYTSYLGATEDIFEDIFFSVCNEKWGRGRGRKWKLFSRNISDWVGTNIYFRSSLVFAFFSLCRKKIATQNVISKKLRSLRLNSAINYISINQHSSKLVRRFEFCRFYAREFDLQLQRKNESRRPIGCCNQTSPVFSDGT